MIPLCRLWMAWALLAISGAATGLARRMLPTTSIFSTPRNFAPAPAGLFCFSLGGDTIAESRFGLR